MRKLSGLVAAGLLAVLAAGAAEAQLKKQPSPVAGSWRGKYVCPQGVTALNMSITDKPGGKLEASFSFGPLPSNPTVRRGAFMMDGGYDASTGEIRLKARSWTKEPAGYAMVDMAGRLSDLGLYITGDILQPGCSTFELVRSEDLVG
jgi:hypothetical protein